MKLKIPSWHLKLQLWMIKKIIVLQDSESDNPEEYLKVELPLSYSNKCLLIKRRRAVQRLARRLQVRTGSRSSNIITEMYKILTRVS